MNPTMQARIHEMNAITDIAEASQAFIAASLQREEEPSDYELLECWLGLPQQLSIDPVATRLLAFARAVRNLP